MIEQEELEAQEFEDSIRSMINENPAVKRAFECLDTGWMSEAEERLNRLLESNPDMAIVYVGKLLLKLRLTSIFDLMNTDKPFLDEKYYTAALELADDKLSEYLNLCSIMALERFEDKSDKASSIEDEMADDGYEKFIEGEGNMTLSEDETAELVQKRKRRNKKIKIASLIAAAIIIAVGALVSVFMVIDNNARAGLIMKDMGEYYEITDCPDSVVTLIIPEEYKGKPISVIDDYAFRNSKNITSVVIPGSITSIGNYAFDNCTKLSSVTMPDNLENIGSFAFSDCDSLTEIRIPNSVTSVGENIFYGCDSLSGVVIGNGITSIPNSMFYECVSLTSIVIPDNVTKIEGYAFYGCTSLESVDIGDAVSSIGIWAFSGCTALVDAYIPNSVENIGEYSFRDCEGLTNVIVGSGVSSIGRYAFYGCDKLEATHYLGTADTWSNITIQNYNDSINKSAIYYYSETQPTEAGDFWHYIDGVPTPW